MAVSEKLKRWARREMRYKAEVDRLAALSASHAKGKEEGLKIAARGMKTENIPIETIVEITGLTEEQVAAL